METAVAAAQAAAYCDDLAFTVPWKEAAEEDDCGT